MNEPLCAISYKKLEAWFEKMPVVAILRGVKPEEVVEIAAAIYEAGIGVIEVTLNSPDPVKSIELLAAEMGDRCIIGAGTVTGVTEVEDVARAGGAIVVTPNTDVNVIKKSCELGLIPMPGWATASESFAAYKAGARYLKLFPATTYGPGHVKALKAVLPDDARILAVGGVGPNNISEWLEAGSDGVGINSEIYKVGDSAETVSAKAKDIVMAINVSRSSGIK